MDNISKITGLLNDCTVEEKAAIFWELRKEIKIHAIEDKLNTQAEIILEAINKDDSGLTFRMLRGVIAEAAFQIEAISPLKNWKDVTPPGDLPYDYKLQDTDGDVRVQVKLQRSVKLQPMTAKEARKKFSSELYVVETQKTRGGIDTLTKESTRPYRYGEFDIIAVSMQPSTGDWGDFKYTVANWLIPHDNDNSKILKFQPVSATDNEDWTSSYEECVAWFRSGKTKTIGH